MGLPEVTKILGARWGTLPEAKKQEYINRHEANRQIYEAQLAEYETANSVCDQAVIAVVYCPSSTRGAHGIGKGRFLLKNFT
jgi:hypothetical protein